MQKVYSVTQVNSYIRGLIEDDLILSEIQMKGELSNVKYHSSGHIYFTLKDSRSAMTGVMFASETYTLDFHLEEGQSVVVTGKIGVFERDGRYQIYAKNISREGAGLLYEKYEKLKKELEEMGMFDAMYKQPIPQFAKVIGVVTAPTGAAVRDIINVSTRRNPHIQILLYPAKVQGEGAAESVVRGIKALEKSEVDTIIVGRGGGSIEDLWAFNEEIVARAIFECSKPVISAVGHETDTTIADWVADKRAPTPSAAAELAVCDYYAVINALELYADRFDARITHRIAEARRRCSEYELRLKNRSPENSFEVRRERINGMQSKLTNLMERRLRDAAQLCDSYADSLNDLMKLKLERNKARLNEMKVRLEALSPEATLGRGYSFVEKNGKPLNSISQVNENDELTVYLRDGKVFSNVTGKEKRTDD